MRRITMKLPQCPECGSFNLRKHAGGRYRCNVCGRTFYRYGESPDDRIGKQASLLADYILSGEHQYAFAKRKGINRGTLNRYLKKFRERRMLWVWRIPRFWKKEEEGGFEFVRRELLNRHILRQGWGEFSIFDGEGIERLHGEKRLRILKPMVLIKEGDILIVPRIEREDYQSFAIVRALGKYEFDTTEESEGFGHMVRVEPIFYFTQRDGNGVWEKNHLMDTIADIVEELRIKRRLWYSVAPVGCLDEYRPKEYPRLIKGVREILSIFET